MKYKNTAHFLGDQIIKKIKQKKGQKGSNKVFIMIISFIVVVLFMFGMIGFAGYWTGDSKIVNTIDRIIPYPAATVNYSIVSLYDWNYEYKAWKSASAKNGTEYVDADLRQNALDKLIKEVLIFDLAKDYKITVTKEELQAEIDSMAQEAGGEELLAEDIKNLFGWTTQEFAQRLLYPELITKKLSEELSISEKAKGEAKKQAQDVLKRINKGDDFATLATEFSDDYYTASNGGEWEWLGRGIVDKVIEDSVFDLPIGQISDLVETDYGYFIIKVEDKRQVASEENPEEMNDEVKLRAILIAPTSFQDEINNVLKDAKVYRFIRYE